MQSKTETLYDMVCGGSPEAVHYYRNLKNRIADGQKAFFIHHAIHSVHERRKAMRGRLHARSGNPHIGADFPSGSYLTPNGKVLTPAGIAQLVSLFRDAAYGGQMSFASPQVVVVPSALSRATAKFTAPGTSASTVQAAILSDQFSMASLRNRISPLSTYMPARADGAKSLGRNIPVPVAPVAYSNTAAQRKALLRGTFGR